MKKSVLLAVILALFIGIMLIEVILQKVFLH